MAINNNNIFGVFTLNEARGSRLTGDWLNKESVANYGWFGGGSGPVATVDRIDFSNDSVAALARGPLSSTRYGPAATGNSNYGWFGGGATPTTATVNRIDFSNDSSTASVRGPLSLARQRLTATGNSNYGWFGGGLIPTPAVVSTVDRIDFSNDSSTASPRSSLSLEKNQLAATGNSNYGWFGGGATPTVISTIDRIDFSNDSATASPRGPLSQARSSLSATGNSNYGWFGNSSRVDRIDFSNDSSTASVRGSLNPSKQNSTATGNSNYGWFGGGFPAVATVDRIDFSNDTGTASPRGGALSAARGYLAATSGVLNIRRQKAGNYGWFGGGFGPAPNNGPYSSVDRIDFSNDLSTISARGTLISPAQGKTNLGATGNSNYGWFGGGYMVAPNASVSSVDRIDFSNDSAKAISRGPLSSVRQSAGFYLVATGNSNYGWFSGATTPGIGVDRIDFTNDSTTASLRGPLSLLRQNLAATGNSNYGWFGGGYIQPAVPVANYYSRVDRIDFSNDSPTASIRGPLSSSRFSLAATGNSNYGWFGGGTTQSTTVSTIDRINFSNDSTAISIRGSLNTPGGRYSLAATGNSNYGWFGGGNNVTFGPTITLISTIDRIDFSNDSTTASTRNTLSNSKSVLAAVSNTPIG
jgi:hypothetical protein